MRKTARKVGRCVLLTGALMQFQGCTDEFVATTLAGLATSLANTTVATIAAVFVDPIVDQLVPQEAAE